MELFLNINYIPRKKESYPRSVISNNLNLSSIGMCCSIPMDNNVPIHINTAVNAVYESAVRDLPPTVLVKELMCVGVCEYDDDCKKTGLIHVYV